jgi:PAS domain S-box-containing protein
MSIGTLKNQCPYNLHATPRQNVSQGDMCCHISHAQKAHLHDQLLRDFNIVDHVGVPLKSSRNETDAILVGLYRCPIANQVEVVYLFILFSGMIIKEMEKKELIEELRTTNKIIEESSNAIIICDGYHKITSLNKAFTRITGYSFKEVKGKNPNMLGAGLHDKYFFKKMWQGILDDGGWSGEIWNKKKNGDIFPEHLSINAIFDEDNNVSIMLHFSLIYQSKNKRKKKYIDRHIMAY